MFGAGEMTSGLTRAESVITEITSSPLLFFYTTVCHNKHMFSQPHLLLVTNESLQSLKTIHVDVKLKKLNMK